MVWMGFVRRVLRLDEVREWFNVAEIVYEVMVLKHLVYGVSSGRDFQSLTGVIKYGVFSFDVTMVELHYHIFNSVVVGSEWIVRKPSGGRFIVQKIS